MITIAAYPRASSDAAQSKSAYTQLSWLNAAAATAFRRLGVRGLRRSLIVLVPMFTGSLVGSLLITPLTDDHFEIAIIPKTWEVTNLCHLQPGDDVNIEVDVLGKYIEKLLISR